jgi:hypothetical protein
MMNKLNEIPKKNPFKVPENYFEEVNRKIISAASGETKEIRRIGFFSRHKYFLLIAASVTVFLLLGYTAMIFLSHNSKTIQLSEVVTGDSPEMYLNDIDIYTLEESIVPVSASLEEPEISKADIIDYLMLDNIEINDIYAQL